MELGRIAVRALGAYVYLLYSTRVSGKRALGEATPFDFIVSVIVGDLIDDALWAEVSLVRFAAASSTIFAADAIVKALALRFDWFFRLVGGTPRVVLRDGIEDRGALRAEQLNEGDLEHLLRLNGIRKDDWVQVRMAAVERDHELSQLPQPWAEPVTPKEKEQVEARLK